MNRLLKQFEDLFKDGSVKESQIKEVNERGSPLKRSRSIISESKKNSEKHGHRSKSSLTHRELMEKGEEKNLVQYQAEVQ